MKLVCALLLLVSLKGFAQYLFEKYSVKKYDSVSFKVVDVNDSTQIAIAKYKSYTVKLLEGNPEDPNGIDGGTILLYFKNKLIKKVNGDFSRITYVIKTLYVEDIDNNGKPDFKIETYYGGCTGLACSRISSIFLLNNGHHFQSIDFESFYNFPQKEYEFDHDGNYEIVGQSLAYYKGHNYWLFDLYNCKNGKLVNVSKKYGYPIAVPYLD